MPVATATPPTATTAPATTTEALARAAIDELVAFWAELPVDPLERAEARAELLASLPRLRRLAEVVGA